MRKFTVVSNHVTAVVYANVVGGDDDIITFQSYDGDYVEFPREGTVVTEM